MLVDTLCLILILACRKWFDSYGVRNKVLWEIPLPALANSKNIIAKYFQKGS